MKPNEIKWWCRNLWAQIKLGGVWGVPRSGLMFNKTAEGFNLSDVARPVSESFKVYQKQDFECIARHFALVGLKVTDSYNLLGASAPSGEGEPKKFGKGFRSHFTSDERKRNREVQT